MFRNTLIRIHVLAVLILAAHTNPTWAQHLSQEMRDIFNEMIPQMDSDLQSKLREALNDEHDYIELTPEQFKRFRDHPANPFEGWNGINPDSIDGLIRLQFETQPIRSRTPCEWERQSSSQLEALENVVAGVAAATVRITNGKTQIALGAIVSPGGHVVTKLSEVAEQDQLFCKTSNDQKYSAKLVGQNKANDIALLKIEASHLPFVKLDGEQPVPGAFLLSTDGESVPMAIGTYSNAPRSLIGKNQAFLGVKPVRHEQGLKIVEVTADSSAEKAGLMPGDVIKTINGRPLHSVDGLVNTIRRNAPGDKIFIEFLREGQRQEVTATLAGRNVGGPTADRFKMMETFGAIPSKRRAEFPLVFQHDTPLLPEQCGGPVTDLEGRVVGINIARGGRVASYAIPAKHVKTLVAELLRPNVASNDID